MASLEQDFGSNVVEIAVDDIGNLDEICKTHLRMLDDMPEDVAERYSATRERVVGAVACEGVYKAFAIKDLDDSSVTFESGDTLKSPALASALQQAELAVIFAVAVKGFEGLTDDLDDSDDPLIDSMLYTGWSIGLATGCQQWFENHLRERAHEFGLHTGKSWSPGLEDVDMRLQRTFFELVEGSRIGLELARGGSLRPSLSVTGLIVVGADPDLELQETLWMI